jgi:Uma2 family endonuclease
MTLTITKAEVFYPTRDDEPMAETTAHALVIITLYSILSQYLSNAVIFADQFFYYLEGKPNARVAPDVMVVFNIPPGMRDYYKLWEEEETPSIIFEITSKSTKERDWGFKKTLYEQIGVTEYWLFDPLGDWIPEQLIGYRLDREGIYQKIVNQQSEVLQLQLQIEGSLIGFYRLDNNQKLLTPNELYEQLNQEKSRADRLAEQLRNLGVDV